MLATAIVAAAATTAHAESTQITIEAVADARGETVATTTDDGLRVDAGTVDAVGLRQPHSGRFVRWRNQRGAYLVFTLRATIVHDSSTVRFELAGGGAETLGFRFAQGDGTDWSQPDSGRALALVGTSIVNPSVQSGQSVLFQVAMPVHNSDKPRQFISHLHYAVTSNGPVVTTPSATPAAGASKTVRAIVPPRPWAVSAPLGDGS